MVKFLTAEDSRAIKEEADDGTLHICTSVSDKCRNLPDSYGEICVRCNACGRNNYATRHRDYLAVLRRHLEECAQFNAWSDDPEIQALQWENMQSTLRRYTRLIKRAEVMAEREKAHEDRKRGEEHGVI